MVDSATEKETRTRETIQTLKLEISNLTKLVEQGAGLSMGQEHRFLMDFCKYNKIHVPLVGVPELLAYRSLMLVNIKVSFVCKKLSFLPILAV